MEESPRGVRMLRSAVRRLLQPLLVWLWKRGQLEHADEMDNFQRRNTCAQMIIGEFSFFATQMKAHDQLAVRVW